MGALFHKDLGAYEMPKPAEDYLDGDKSGRCKIVCFDAGGSTVVCGIVYGWTGAKKGSNDADRADDILSILQTLSDAMEPGPKLIMGDLNGSLENFPAGMALIKEHGWADIGNDD